MTLNEFYDTDWFTERPKGVRELFYRFPINQEHYLRIPDSNAVYGVWILGWEGNDEKEQWTARIHRDDVLGVLSHQVFDVKAEDLLSLAQVIEQGLEIKWQSRKPHIIE